MKKRMLKIIATVLSLVLVFSCVSTGATALKKDGVKVPTLDGYVAFDVMVNASQTRAALALLKTSDETVTFGITATGSYYNIVNFDKYLAADSNYLLIKDYTVKGDDFLFLVQSLYVTEVYSDETLQYELVYDLVETAIVSTKNGTDFEKTVVNLKTNHDTRTDDYLYNAFGLFDVVGDELVFANLAFELKDFNENNGHYFANGVYYTSEDMKSWVPNETEKYLKYDSANNYYSTAYKNINGNLLRENWRICDKDKYEREMILEEVYFKNKKIFDLSREAEYTTVYSLYGVLNDVPNTVFRFESVLPEEYYKGTDDGSVRIVKFDLESNTEEVLWESESDFSWDIINTSDAIYFLIKDEKEGCKIYRFDEDMVLEQIQLDEDFEISFAYELQEKAFIVTDKKVYVIDENKIKKYTVSDYIEDTGCILAFEIKGVFVVIETPEGRDAKAFASANDKYEIGDVDGDGKIISSDALLVLQCSTGLKVLTYEQRSIADVNSDGEINSSDALNILQYATGLITSFK